LLINVHVFDGVNEARVENANVLIEADGAILIDGQSRTMIPGLIDMHWHTSFRCMPQSVVLTGDTSDLAVRANSGAERMLLRGVTTVRDMGGNPFATEKMVVGGELVGPRILPSGAPISQASGHFDFRLPQAVPTNPGDALDHWSRDAVLMLADGVPRS